MKKGIKRSMLAAALFTAVCLGASESASDKAYTINDQEYLEAPGHSILVFHNIYPLGKQGGIEIIQHGVRVATNGDLRLEPSPGQWDPLPETGKREVDTEKGEIRVPLHYPDVDLDYTVRVRPEGKGVRISVDLAKPLPSEWVGKVRMNLELYPPEYYGKTFFLGDTQGVFRR